MSSLRDLGLGDYEARTYRTLLQTGPATAKDLSRASDVPMGRIYDILNSLESDQLVRSQESSRPKKYIAVEPETALDRLFESRRAELEAEIERYETIAEELTEELDPAEPADEQFWTTAIGPEDTVDLLVERIRAANEQLIIVASTPSSQFDIGTVGDRIVGSVESALVRDVTVSVLITPALLEMLPRSTFDRYTDALADFEHFTVRTTTDLSGSFYLIDHHEVCIEVQNPLDSNEPFGLIDLKDAEFASNVHESFQERWTNADPVDFFGRSYVREN
ncbi:MAG: helix-turn-helix domain-containing protein [Halobacteriales archaeon]|nr:helix-turn-helix domain-containing protein [Halobacteriales archaeon]